MSSNLIAVKREKQFSIDCGWTIYHFIILVVCVFCYGVSVTKKIRNFHWIKSLGNKTFITRGWKEKLEDWKFKQEESKEDNNFFFVCFIYFLFYLLFLPCAILNEIQFKRKQSSLYICIKKRENICVTSHHLVEALPFQQSWSFFNIVQANKSTNRRHHHHSNCFPFLFLW